MERAVAISKEHLDFFVDTIYLELLNQCNKQKKTKKTKTSSSMHMDNDGQPENQHNVWGLLKGI